MVIINIVLSNARNQVPMQAINKIIIAVGATIKAVFTATRYGAALHSNIMTSSTANNGGY